MRHTGSDLVVDTGVLRAELTGAQTDFLASCAVASVDGWRRLLPPGTHLFMSDQDGTRHDSLASAPPPVLEVEESGPLRAALRLTGFHTSRMVGA